MLIYVLKQGKVLFNDILNTFYFAVILKEKGNFTFNDALNTFYFMIIRYRAYW